MSISDFRTPHRLDEALSTIKQLGPLALVVAGGTSFIFAPVNEDRVAVDINGAGLDGIRRENGGFRVGAATRLSALQKHHEAGWVLDRVAIHLASQQLRNMSTLGGNIARIFPWSDFAVALQALGATMVIAENGERQVGADEYFSSQPARLFKNGGLLTAVIVPAVGGGAGFGYRKQTQASFGFSLMTVAACMELEGRTVKSVRVAAGAGIPFPSRLKAVEEAVKGQAVKEGVFADAAARGLAGLKFKSNAGMSEEYIANLARVLVGDALTEAWQSAEGGAA